MRKKTFKIAVNKADGEFWLSEEAIKYLEKREPGILWGGWIFDESLRTHPALIKCVEELKEQASTAGALITIEEHKGTRFVILHKEGVQGEIVCTPDNDADWKQVWPQWN